MFYKMTYMKKIKLFFLNFILMEKELDIRSFCASCSMKLKLTILVSVFEIVDNINYFIKEVPCMHSVTKVCFPERLGLLPFETLLCH